jgi:hypothetical protein
LLFSVSSVSSAVSRYAARRQIIADGAVETDVERVRDQRVADRDFVEMRQRAEERQVVQIEVVARVDAEAQRVGEVGGGGIAAEAALSRLGA